MSVPAVAQAQSALEQEVPETLGLPTHLDCRGFGKRYRWRDHLPSHWAFGGLRRANIKLAVALVVAVGIFAGASSVLHRRSATGTSAYVEVDAQPWATVRTLAANDGKTITVNQATPVRLALPRGEYTIVLAGPAGTEATGHLTVAPGQVNSYKHDFEVVDVKKIVDSY